MLNLRNSSGEHRNSVRQRVIITTIAAAVLSSISDGALANNYGESLGWQFRTTADRANQAAILDLIAKRRSGYYTALVYNTSIAQQNNCAVTATATGNAGSQTAQANSPTVAGATSSATDNASTATSNGRRSASNTDQANDTAQVISSEPVLSSSVSVTGKVTTATARSNRADQSLLLDPLDLTLEHGPTKLRAGDDHAVADAGVAVVNHQSLRGAPVSATSSTANTALGTGSVSVSKLALTANTQSAAALGNDGANAITLAGVSSDSGAGIVSVQKTDAASSVSATSSGLPALSTRFVDASTLDVSANLVRATSYGNAVDNALSAKLVRASLPVSAGIASMVPATGDGDAAVGAAFGVLSVQSLGGNITSTAGDQSRLIVPQVSARGDLTNASLNAKDNSVSSTAIGNQSGNRADLDISTVGASAYGRSGPIANITNVQRIGEASVGSRAGGGVDLFVDGNVESAAVVYAGNSVRTAATGNLAVGNALSVKANQLGDATNTPGGGDPGLTPVGTAQIGDDGNASTTAGLSVQNVQDYGSSGVNAQQSSPSFTASLADRIKDSTIAVSGNVAANAATGNDATNSLAVNAGLLRSGADLNNVQRGEGNVETAIGSTTARGGAVIASLGPVTSSSLAVERNTATATSIGNVAANEMSLSVNTLGNDSGHTDAVAGSIGSGYGAAATLALANDQSIGHPIGLGAPLTQISSAIYGKFVVNGYGGLDDSSVSLSDNTQRATAVANTASNALTLSATSISADNGPAAGAAVSSIQFGQADVHATSAMRLVANGGSLTHSNASVSGNANQSVAVINDVANKLAISATGAGSLTGFDAIGSVNVYGPPYATGDQSLANQQFASGSATADSITLPKGVGGVQGLTASTLRVTGNLIRADATANQAINALTASAASGDARSGALTSTQMSVARVSATAETTIAGLSNSGATAGVYDSALAIDTNTTAALARGNVADNAVSLAGANNPSSVPTVYASRYGSDVSAQVALVNSQTNLGSVKAIAISAPTPLNTPDGPTILSTIGVAGNIASAAAFGNVASNAASVSALGRLPTAAVANVQSNRGAITAQVTGASYASQVGALTSSARTLSGNQVVATATGNQATNVITSIR